ncbi:hypothetical protein GV819_00765 [Pseudomonas sp. Fl5BN2]|uniref:hypothetical protein n=1 Tax=Pseudomonas sp. Fl5BN2 TaxID=2697652 RepID=UPI001376AF97|nr:hypothetical protein [Pseudomonas sp. Fl5BN2]NBF00813.1 hypothetical protein [Pseudomonas sp. Fl5BN2]
MNIFVISQESARGQQSKMAAYLSQVRLQPSRLTSVVVIDECAWSTPQELPVPTFGNFLLDDFLHEKGSVNNGEFIADANVIGAKLGAASESWLIIDFGLHDCGIALDFIRKLATFTFLSKDLREKNIALLMPRPKLGFMGRHVNATFNSTASGSPAADADSYRLFLLSIMLEKLYLNWPIIAWPIVKVRQLARFFYQRVVRVRT